MFFKRTSQQVFRDSCLDFAAGLHAAKPFLFPCLPLSKPPVGLRGSLFGGKMTKLLLLQFQSDNHLMTPLFSKPWWLSIQCFPFSLRSLAALYSLPCSLNFWMSNVLFSFKTMLKQNPFFSWMSQEAVPSSTELEKRWFVWGFYPSVFEVHGFLSLHRSPQCMVNSVVHRRRVVLL